MRLVHRFLAWETVNINQFAPVEGLIYLSVSKVKAELIFTKIFPRLNSYGRSIGISTRGIFLMQRKTLLRGTKNTLCSFLPSIVLYILFLLLWTRCEEADFNKCESNLLSYSIDLFALASFVLQCINFRPVNFLNFFSDVRMWVEVFLA
jgi:hypothetical protein